MPRYIDADALRKEFSERPPDYYSTGYILDTIDELPALSTDDVRGVGKWEEKEVFDLENTTIEQMQSARCSSCGKYHTTPFSYYFDNFNYCPNCGARLLGGENDS